MGHLSFTCAGTCTEADHTSSVGIKGVSLGHLAAQRLSKEACWSRCPPCFERRCTLPLMGLLLDPTQTRKSVADTYRHRNFHARVLMNKSRGYMWLERRSRAWVARRRRLRHQRGDTIHRFVLHMRRPGAASGGAQSWMRRLRYGNERYDEGQSRESLRLTSSVLPCNWE